MSGLPKAKQFPKLPDGYVFKVGFQRVSTSLRVNEYRVSIGNRITGIDKVSAENVPEELVLRTAREQSELFHLQLAETEFRNRANQLTLELREV